MDKKTNTILFSHSYFLRFDKKQWKLGQPYAPLGTIFAASLLRKNGYDVALFDSMFAEKPEEVIRYLEEFRPSIFVIYDDGFNYLTKMCLTNMREAAFRMAEFAKERGCKVIVSSSDSTDHFEKYLNHGADVVIKGEAEQTLLELVNSYSNNALDLDTIKGLIYKKQEQIVHTPKREVMRDLDALPLPAWDLVDMAKYKSVWKSKYNYFSINIATTRGCPFKCNWCAKPIYGNRYNTRSEKQVVEELLYLKTNYQFDHVWFCDDIFGLKPGWINEFAIRLEEVQLKFKYKIQSRVDLLLEENNIAALAKSGCDTVWVGAESGSQKILDAMDKGTKVEQIYEASRLLKKQGIKTAFFLQFGYLNETMEDIKKTIQMLNDLLPDDIGASISYPLPGTKFYEKVKEQLKEKTNWSDSDELILMFKNTYSPKFYKQLHRYIHKNYRKRQALQSLKQTINRPLQIEKGALKKIASLIYYFPITYIEHNRLNKLTTIE